MTVKIFYWNEEKEDFDRRRYNMVKYAHYEPYLRQLNIIFLSSRLPVRLNIDKNVCRIMAGKRVLYERGV